MDDGFIPLATFVRGSESLARAAGVVPITPGDHCPGEHEPVAAPLPQVARGLVDFAHADTVHELALMRLAAFEGFERAKAVLLATLASEVLSRELSLAPADLEALMASALERFREFEPVSIAISPCDAPLVHTPLPMRVDPSLEAGDLIVDVRDGALESHFHFRLQAALDRALLRNV